MHNKIGDLLFFQHDLIMPAQPRPRQVSLPNKIHSLTDISLPAFDNPIMTACLHYPHFSSALHLVICDMDGLLLDTERLSEDSFRQTSTAFKLDFDDSLFAALTGLSGPAHLPVLKAHLPRHIEAAAFDKLWKQTYHNSLANEVPVKDQAAAFVSHIKATGVCVAVATSSRTDKAVDQLTKVGLASYFDLIVGGDQVSKAKPHPEIYHKVISSFHLQAEQVLVLEDSNNGARAGLAAGANVIQVPDRLPPDPAFANLPSYDRQDSLKQVQAHLSVAACGQN